MGAYDSHPESARIATPSGFIKEWNACPFFIGTEPSDSAGDQRSHSSLHPVYGE